MDWVFVEATDQLSNDILDQIYYLEYSGITNSRKMA